MTLHIIVNTMMIMMMMMMALPVAVALVLLQGSAALVVDPAVKNAPKPRGWAMVKVTSLAGECLRIFRKKRV